MARLLVTGGSGFIGTHLVERLRQAHEIVNVDRQPPKLAEHRSYWRQLDIKDAPALRPQRAKVSVPPTGSMTCMSMEPEPPACVQLAPPLPVHVQPAATNSGAMS